MFRIEGTWISFQVGVAILVEVTAAAGEVSVLLYRLIGYLETDGMQFFMKPPS